MRALVVLLATAGGAGFAPLVPGTVGALVAFPFLPPLAALRARSTAGYAAVIVLLVGVAVWSAGRAEEIFGGHDHSRIVIDEVAGLVVAGVFIPGTWGAALLAFVLFRLFDLLKPFPAGTIDRRVRGGLGVVGDDLVAGVYAGLAARVLLAVV